MADPIQYMPTSGLQRLFSSWDIPLRRNGKSFTCEASQCGPQAMVLEVSGDIDAVTVPQLAATLAPLAQSELHVVVLDLHRVTFLSTSGLEVLLESREALRHADCQLRLAGPSRAVVRPLTLLKLVDTFDIHGDDVSSALTAGGVIR